MPLAHPPGEAQVDFGEALVIIAGVECKAHFLVMDLATPATKTLSSIMTFFTGCYHDMLYTEGAAAV